MGDCRGRRVLLLGWDGADWQIIQPLLDAGRMPHLEQVILEGVMGNLASLRPMLSPMLWTSMATGKRADRHGVYGFVEPRPNGRGIRPVAATSLKARPLWSILTGRGRKSAVVGWYATHPAAHPGGTVISNLFRTVRGENFDQWPLPAQTVAPTELQEIMRDLRLHPADLILEQLRFFIPEAHRIDQDQDQRLGKLSLHLAECATVHAAGTYLAEHADWDLLAVYLDAIDRLGHEFMWYRAPQMARVDDRDFALYREVVDRCYEYHDLMLGRYMNLVGPETTIVLVSDHGFFSDHRRPPLAEKGGPPPPLMCHRPYGIFVARGPGLKEDGLVFGASILDVAPTVLTLLGLPVGRDMEGRVLPIFAGPMEPEFIDTYETEGSREDSPDDLPEEDPWAAQEALKQLVALGYVEAPPPDAAQAVEQVTAQKLNNLAEVHLAKGEYVQAEALLKDLSRRRPGDRRLTLSLAQCRLNLGDLAGCEELLDEVYHGKLDLPGSRYAYGLLEFARKNWGQALTHFRRAAASPNAPPQIHRQLGLTYLRQGKLTPAAAAFEEALTVEGDQPQAYDGLGLARYRQKRYAEAEECFLRSLGCFYHQPLVHYHLGAALAAQGKLTAAAQTLHRVLEFRPKMKAAHKLLTRVYRAMGNQALAHYHKIQARDLPDQEPDASGADL